MHQIEITYTRNLRTQCNHIQSGDKINVSMTLNIEKLVVNYKIEDDLNL